MLYQDSNHAIDRPGENKCQFGSLQVGLQLGEKKYAVVKYFLSNESAVEVRKMPFFFSGVSAGS